MFEDVKDEQFVSMFLKSNVTGPNPGLAKGPKDDILL
jgi:hypothetical protein